MIPALTRSFHWLAFVAAFAAPLAPARALVGAQPDSRFADRVAMVLIRGGDKAGFCSALVLSPRVSSDRRPLPETLAGHGGPLSGRRGSGGHHSS